MTAAQVWEVITRLIAAGHWRGGDRPVLVIVDAGYDPMRLACRLADLPVEVLGRLRSDRVLRFPVPPCRPGTNGRPPRHGRQFALADSATWPEPGVTTTTATTRYGTAVAQTWDRLHPRLTHRSAWMGHDGPLPVIEGTLIRLQVDHLPGDRDPKPVWLWCSVTGAPPAEVDRLRLPWERPAPPGRLTPARVAPRCAVPSRPALASSSRPATVTAHTPFTSPCFHAFACGICAGRTFARPGSRFNPWLELRQGSGVSLHSVSIQ